MASSTLAASSLLATPSYVADRSSFSSSSSPFVDSTLRLAPIKLRTPRAALSSPTCTLLPEDRNASNSTARRNIVAGVIATGAALAVFANATLAATGPGISGPQRTAQKADELLKSADKLNNQEAPRRFGPARTGFAEDAGNVAQRAGSGAVGDLQEGFKSIFGQGQEKKREIEKGAQDIVGQTQSGGGILSSLQDRVQGLKENVKEKDAEAKNALQEAERRTQGIVQ